MRVVVIGGGAAGSVVALLLARAGHDVVVLERDRVPAYPDVEAAARHGWRPGAPHLVQPHALNARARRLLVERLPDVADELFRLGAAEAAVTPRLPDHEDLTMLLSRRSTFDLALRRALDRQPGVTRHDGVQVTGLRTAPDPVARVTGVRCGDEELEADVVVDATGRRTPVDRWLRTAGAAPTTVDSAECGLAYFSRHYLVREGSAIPPGAPRMLVARDGHLLGLWVGDNAAVQLAVVPLVGDRRFRELAEVGLFTRTLLEEPSFARWLTVLAPTGPVHVMGGVRNSLRRLVVDGRPVVRGLHVVGDSLCTTNPTLSRGLALTFTAAVDLVDVLTRHPDDSLQQALVYDAHVDRHVAPYFRDQVAIDAERLTELRHAAFGTSPARRRRCATAVSFGELRDASPRDLVVERAFWRLQGMVCDPHAVYADPEVVRRTRAVLATPRGHELRNTSRKKSTEERSHVAAHR